MNVDIYEIEYSVSPGGINQWAVDIRTGLGTSSYAEFDTIAEAMDWLLNKYPDKELNITLRSLNWYHRMSEAYDTIGA